MSARIDHRNLAAAIVTVLALCALQAPRAHARPSRHAAPACRRRALSQSLALDARRVRAAAYRGVIRASPFGRGSAQATAMRGARAGAVKLSIVETFRNGSLTGTISLRYRRRADRRLTILGAAELRGTIGSVAVKLARARVSGVARIGSGGRVRLALRIIGRARRCPLRLSAPLGWSGPIAVSPAHFLAAVACPASDLCTALSEYPGAQVAFNPLRRSVSAPVTIDPLLALAGSLSCPTPSQCTALDGEGRELTFDPRAPAAPRPVAIDTAQPEALDCPSPSQCTAVDDLQGEITFDAATLTPSSPPAPWSLLGGGVLSAIACPSQTQCTALSPGQEVTFDPLTAAVSTRATLQAHGSLAAIACPAISQCTAVGADGVELTFNPAAPRRRRQALIAGASTLAAIACPAQRRCVAVTANGLAVTFDPQAPQGSSRSALETASPAAPLTGVSCPSVQECVAVDAQGRAFVALAPAAANARR